MRVLVLGWEYPPAVAGGLGAACHGLTQALAARGHSVLLTVPATEASETSEASLAVDAPGIERIEVSVSGDDGASSGSAQVPLSPYAFDRADSGDSAGGAEGTAGGASSRARASRRLYGDDLRAAIGRYTHAVLQSVSERHFDVIHAHDWMTIPAALRLRMQTRRPVALHVHSTSFDRTGSALPTGQHSIAAVERAGVRTADRVLAVSAYTQQVLTREYGVDPARISVVHNAAPPPVVGSAGAPTGPPTILFLARLTRQKGAGFFLRAAARVHAKRPDVRFVIAGEGEDRRALIEQSASLGIAHRTFFPGSIDDPTRERLYAEATVFALTSVSEPFGLTPLEALRRGTPSVLCDTSGVREVLPSAPAVPAWDTEGLADALLAIVSDPTRRAKLVREGLRDIEPVTWNASAQALEDALLAAQNAGRLRA